MPLDRSTYLLDMKGAAAKIATFASGQSWDDYLASDLLRSAVERLLGEIPA